jgi:hypothetical protein
MTMKTMSGTYTDTYNYEKPGRGRSKANTPLKNADLALIRKKVVGKW